jgi:hypothetical protein
MTNVDNEHATEGPDVLLVCKDCGGQFTFTSAQRDFFAARAALRTETVRTVSPPEGCI